MSATDAFPDVLKSRHIYPSFIIECFSHSRAAVGDCVVMRPEAGELPYIGKIEKLFTVAEGKKQEKIKARWYYRPSEAKGGRRAVSLQHQSSEPFTFILYRRSPLYQPCQL